MNLTGRVTSVATVQVPDGVDNANSGWLLQLLNGSVQGTTLYQRIGQKIVQMKMYMRLFVAPSVNGAQSNEAGMVRAIVVYDAQANATAFSGATLATAVLKTNTTLTAPQNLDNRERFRVLMDKTYYIGIQDRNAAGQSAIIFSERSMVLCKKWKSNLRMDTLYNSGNAGTIGDIQTGAIYLLVGTSITNSVAANTVVAAVSGESRIRFYDA